MGRLAVLAVLLLAAPPALGYDYCLGISGGGYRSLIATLAFMEAQREVGSSVNIKLFAGTSGGAWGAYAACRGSNIRKFFEEKHIVGMSLTDQLDVLVDPFQTSSEDFRSMWWRNLLRVYRDLGVPTTKGKAHDRCVHKIIVTQAKTQRGAKGCDNVVYCRNFRGNLHCDDDTGRNQRPENFRDALITSSSAVTTDEALERSPEHPIWLLVPERHEPANTKLLQVEKYGGPQTLLKEDSVFFDIGTCDNNPWPELIPKCKKIINIDVSSGRGHLGPSLQRAKSMSQDFRHKPIISTFGRMSKRVHFADEISLLTTPDRYMRRVLNLTPFYSRAIRSFPAYCNIPTSVQTFPLATVKCYYKRVKKYFRRRQVQALINRLLQK